VWESMRFMAESCSQWACIAGRRLAAKHPQRGKINQLSARIRSTPCSCGRRRRNAGGGASIGFSSDRAASRPVTVRVSARRSGGFPLGACLNGSSVRKGSRTSRP